MPDYLRFGTLAFTSLLAVLNPLSTVPMYAALTASFDKHHRADTVRRAALTAFIVMIVFALAGRYVLRFFGITTHAFQIAGGILFFGIGWDMLQARRSRVKTTEEEESEYAAKDDVAIIPLGMPSLAGPGTITTVIVLDSQAKTFPETASIYVSIVLVTLIAWAVLSAAPFVIRRLGQTGMNIFTRVMGLLVMVIGAQFVIIGVTVVARGIMR